MEKKKQEHNLCFTACMTMPGISGGLLAGSHVYMSFIVGQVMKTSEIGLPLLQAVGNASKRYNGIMAVLAMGSSLGSAAVTQDKCWLLPSALYFLGWPITSYFLAPINKQLRGASPVNTATAPQLLVRWTRYARLRAVTHTLGFVASTLLLVFDSSSHLQ